MTCSHSPAARYHLCILSLCAVLALALPSAVRAQSMDAVYAVSYVEVAAAAKDTAAAAIKQWSEALGMCVPICPRGTMLDAKGVACVSDRKSCPVGKEWKDPFGACVPICPLGQVLDFYGHACHSIKIERRR